MSWVNKLKWALFGNDDDGDAGQVTLQRPDGWLTKRLIARNPHLERQIYAEYKIPFENTFLADLDHMLKEYGYLIKAEDYREWWFRNKFHNLFYKVINWKWKTVFLSFQWSAGEKSLAKVYLWTKARTWYAGDAPQVSVTLLPPDIQVRGLPLWFITLEFYLGWRPHFGLALRKFKSTGA